MLIESNNSRPFSAEIHPSCKQLIDNLISAPNNEIFLERLAGVHEWQSQFGKCEMGRWSEVLNRCDAILGEAALRGANNSLGIDEKPEMLPRIMTVLSFTALLFENTFSRSVYNSIEHLLALLESGDVNVIVEVLRLLLVISKRSKYITQHLNETYRKALAMRLVAIAQSWNAKLRRFRMNDCCQEIMRTRSLLPICFQTANVRCVVQEVELSRSFGEELEGIIGGQKIEEEERISLAARLRLVRSFSDLTGRRSCVIARLLSLSVILYSHNLIEESVFTSLVYDGIISEISQLLFLNVSVKTMMDSVKTEALRTLTSIIAADRSAMLNSVVDALNVNTYNGYLPRTTRRCVDDLCSHRIGTAEGVSVQFCTALFSLLYHVSGFEPGVEALSQGMLTQTLVRVVENFGLPLENISFATRAVRVIDNMTQYDLAGFSAVEGMTVVVKRIVYEVSASENEAVEVMKSGGVMEQCHQQRAALIKSLLNFMRRAIQDSQFVESVRRVMDGDLPNALKSVITKCDFYGASLFQNAISVTTNFIYQEPNMLTALQDRGLTGAVMTALLSNELPISREILQLLPVTFTAMCLNERGISQFLDGHHFEHFCKIFLSIKFLLASKRRRNEINEVPLGIGTAFDDYMRHHPALRAPLLGSFAKMLDRLIEVANGSVRAVMLFSSCRNLRTAAGISTSTDSAATANSVNAGAPDYRPMLENPNASATSSDDDDDDTTSATHNLDNVPPTVCAPTAEEFGLSMAIYVDNVPIVPLGEYILNTCRMLEALLTHNITPELSDAFIITGLAEKLLSLTYVKQIPYELSYSAAPQMIANMLRYLFQHARCNDVTEMVGLKMKYFCDELIQSCRNNENQSSPCLLRNFTLDTVLPILCAISHLQNCLTTISKAALSSHSAVKSSVLRFWTGPVGTAILEAAFTVQRIALWELASSQVSEIATCSQFTQTEQMFMNSEQTESQMNCYTAEDKVDRECAPRRPKSLKYSADGAWQATKSGFSILMRLSAQFNEMVTMLTKLCNGTTTRTRRVHDLSTSSPSESASLCVMNCFAFYFENMMWQHDSCEDPSPRMSFLRSWLTGLSGIMFDERKFPYYLLLSTFNRSGCHDAVFEVITPYICVENIERYGAEVCRLLHTWLAFVGKLVNVHYFRTSRYKLSARCYESKFFIPDKYLMKCHQATFRALSETFAVIMKLPLAEALNLNIYASVISIYKEVIEDVINPENQRRRAAVAAEERKRLVQELDEANISVLLDMGFDREMAVDALLNFSTISEAAEHLVRQPRTQNRHGNNDEQPADLDESGLRLFENPESSEVQGVSEAQNENAEAPATNGSRPTALCPLADVRPPDMRNMLDILCDKVIPVLMQIMQQSSDLVMCTADLVRLLIDDSEEGWKKEKLVNEYLTADLIHLIDQMKANPGNERVLDALATRLHFGGVLWEDIPQLYMDACKTCCLPKMIVDMLEIVSMNSGVMPSYTRLIAPVCLWIDMYDKILRMEDDLMKVTMMNESFSWKYWGGDDRNMNYTWHDYPLLASVELTKAFLSGRRKAVISIGGRQYVADFVTMSHRNQETGAEHALTVCGKIGNGTSLEAQLQKQTKQLSSWQQAVSDRVIPAIVGLLNLKDNDGLAVQAMFILAARVTRDFHSAKQFLERGGVEAAIQINAVVFPTSTLYITMLIRHCMDDEAAVSQIFEKTIRSITASGYSITPNTSRWQNVRMTRTTRDWQHLLRALAPLSARHPLIFLQTMERVVRKENNTMTVVPLLENRQSISSAPIKRVITILMKPLMDPSWNDARRVVTRATLLKLLAEYVKSYSSAASIIADATGSNDQPAVVSILEACFSSEEFDAELIASMKAFARAMASCIHSPKAQECLISSIVTCLHLSCDSAERLPKVFCSKVKRLADFVWSARLSCPTASDSREVGWRANAITRLIVKKRVCNELARVPWYLNLSTNEGIEAVNHVLKILEDLARVVNSSSSGAEDSASVPAGPRASASVVLATVSENDASATIVTAREPGEEPHSGQIEYAEEDTEDHGGEGRQDSDEDSSDNEDDDDDDDGDEDDNDAGGNEMDVEDESDDEDREVEAEEEYADVFTAVEQPSDDEDDYHVMDEMEPTAIVSQYVLDGDADISGPISRMEDEPDESAFIYENVEEALDPVTNRTGVFISMQGLEANQQDNNAATVTHPLMQREPQNTTVDAVASRTSGYRLVLNQRRSFSGLHRQNAVRRWAAYGPQNDLFERIVDTAGPNGPQIFDVVSARQRLFNIVDGTLEAAPLDMDERRLLAIPSPLERFSQAAAAIDGHTHLYVWMLVISHLDGILSRRAEEAKVNETEESRKAAEDGKSGAQSGASTLTNEEQNSADHEQPITFSRETSTGTEVGETSADVEETASTSEETENTTDIPELTTSECGTAVSVAEELIRAYTSNAASASGVSTPLPGDSEIVMTAVETTEGDYRAVLGDLEIPEGVDPAFLAALPEDIRGEVVRDHVRQQRAQRIQQAADSRQQNAEGEPIIEPLDQEFLSALPPELQEEILSHHERTLRLANERNENAANNAGASTSTDDAAAWIESLPPTLRASVLADADDSELQALPENVAEEARRLRATYEAEVLRFARMLVPPQRYRVRNNQTGFGAIAPLGSMAGQTTIASKALPQMFDREAIATMVILFFLDSSRLSHQRLQKLFKAICSHYGTCDFVIWCLLALLSQLLYDDVSYEEVTGTPAGWIDSVCVATGGIGQRERALKVYETQEGFRVTTHPALTDEVARMVLDTLISIAKTYPGHFLPNKLRPSDQRDTHSSHVHPYSQFWSLVFSIMKPEGGLRGHARHLTGVSSEQAVFGPLHSGVASATVLEECGLGFVMDLMRGSLVQNYTTIQDKLFRLMCTIAQTLPNDTLTKMSIDVNKINAKPPLATQLISIVSALTDGMCTNAGLSDGRLFLMEMSRALAPTTSSFIQSLIVGAAERLGKRLLPQIINVEKELTALQDNPNTSSAGALATALYLDPPEVSSDRSLTVGTALHSASASASSSSLATAMQLASSSTSPPMTATAVEQSDTLLSATPSSSSDAVAGELGIVSAPDNSVHTAIDVQPIDPVTASNLNISVTTTIRISPVETNVNTRTTDSTLSGLSEPYLHSSSLTVSSVELCVPAMRDLVDKQGVQMLFLKSLKTIVKIREVLKNEWKRNEEEGNKDATRLYEEERMSILLKSLDPLWESTSNCLRILANIDAPSALALQPTAEAFFLVFGSSITGVEPSRIGEHPDAMRLLAFAERHRDTLNHVLRQSTHSLSEGPFSVLIQLPRLLDFDVKRKYFRKQLSRMTDTRLDDVQIRIRRSHLFSDSFRELFRLRLSEWKARFYVTFEGEEGQDAGGLLREWFCIITREIFNPNYALFITAPGDRVTYMINKSSYINQEHLHYFKFVGKVIAKAIYEGKSLDCYFTRAFYKHILSVPVRTQDLESEDPSFYKSLQYLLENPVENLGTDLTFSIEIEEFGVRSMRDLKENGSNILVTDENKAEYVKLVCQMKMTGSIKQQLNAFLEGFYEIIPKDMISIFDEQELELLISGLPYINIDDLYANTEYKNYTRSSPQIQWFWRALRSFDRGDLAKFLQFVTGTSKVPLQGFSALEGMNGVQKFSIHLDSRSPNRLPTAHTCFNQLDLPQYKCYQKLRDSLLTAVRECTEGFGFA